MTCFNILLFKKTHKELIALIVNIEYENKELNIWINREVLSKREYLISWSSVLKEIKNLNNNNIKKKGKNNNLNLTYSEENIDIKKCEKKKTISNNVVTKLKTETGFKIIKL